MEGSRLVKLQPPRSRASGRRSGGGDDDAPQRAGDGEEGKHIAADLEEQLEER